MQLTRAIGSTILLFTALGVLWIANSVAQTTEPPEGVTVRVDFTYQNFSSKITLYRVPEDAVLWRTRSVPTLADASVTSPLASNELQLLPGDRQRFALVMHNTTRETLYFFAAPHVMTPEENTLGLKFLCLCINQAFQVKPGHVWYRVVELQVDEAHQGRTLRATHRIIGLDEERGQYFSNPLNRMKRRG